jgi:hypothetical protein
MFQRMNQEVSTIIDGCITLAYFMRGGVQYHALLDTSPAERSSMNEFIEKRLEQESKKMHPVY